MTKDQATAIIKALEESVTFMMTNGIAPRQQISDPDADAAYVAGLVTGYSTAMDAIIANIPDDEP